MNRAKTDLTRRPAEKIEQEAKKHFSVAQRLREEAKYKDAQALVAFMRRHLVN